MKIHEEFRNYRDNFEHEANSEEKKFDMSVINATCSDKNKIEDIEKILNELNIF
jgi:hypothetical protein